MIGATRYVAQSEINRQAQLAADISKLQESISSGKRLSAPSDDPAAAARISEIRQTQANETVYTANVNTGTAIANAADDQLSTVASALDRAKELMLSGSNDTNSATDRAALATELRGIAQDIQTYSNATDPNGQPLFPAGTPIAIPVSDSLSISATDSQANIFGNVTTAAGSKSIVDILNQAADSLELGDGDITVTNPDGTTSTTTRSAQITASLGEVTDAVNHIASVRTDQGIREQRFQAAGARLTASATDLTTERSSLEDTDLTYAVSTFQSKQLSLQAAQTVYAQSQKTSLFSLLG